MQQQGSSDKKRIYSDDQRSEVNEMYNFFTEIKENNRQKYEAITPLPNNQSKDLNETGLHEL